MSTDGGKEVRTNFRNCVGKWRLMRQCSDEERSDESRTCRERHSSLRSSLLRLSTIYLNYRFAPRSSLRRETSFDSWISSRRTDL